MILSDRRRLRPSLNCRASGFVQSQTSQNHCGLVLDVGPRDSNRRLQIGAGLWRLLPLHVERHRNAIDSLARLDHILRGLGILLEVRRLQMRLERVGILVDLEWPHPRWIVLFEDRTEGTTSGL